MTCSPKSETHNLTTVSGGGVALCSVPEKGVNQTKSDDNGEEDKNNQNICSKSTDEIPDAQEIKEAKEESYIMYVRDCFRDDICGNKCDLPMLASKGASKAAFATLGAPYSL